MANTHTIRIRILTDEATAPLNRVARHFKDMEGQALKGVKAVQEGAKAQVVSIESLAVKGLQLQSRLTKAAEDTAAKAATASKRSTDVQILGLNQLQASGLKLQDRLTKAAEDTANKASSASKRSTESQIIGLNQLQASGLKLQARLTAETEKGAATRTAAEKAAYDKIGRDNERSIDRMLANIKRHDAQWKNHLTEQEIALIVHNAKIKKSNDERVDAALRGAGLERKGLKGIADEVGSTVAAYFTFQGVIRLLGDVGSALDAARTKQKLWADGFKGQRDQLRELAAIEGKPLDNQYSLNFAQGNVATGMKPDEALAFQTEFQNSGAQYKGKNISDAEYDQFKEQSAKLAVARGIDPRIAGDFAGNLLGFHDYKKHGDNASEEATGRTNTSLGILGRGKGRNSILVDQMSRIMSASLNEDEMKGTFKNEEEVAIATSLMAEYKDEEASTYIRASMKGLRDFEIPKDKFGREKKDAKGPGKLLKKAGIDANTPYLDAIAKLGPVVEAEAKAKGVKTEDILRENFEDERTIKGLAVGINKGLGPGGVIADRRDFAAKNRGQVPAFGLIDQFQASEAGQSRVADAKIKLAEETRGAETSKLDIIRRQAYAELIKDKMIGTPSQAMQEFVNQKASFGLLSNPEQEKINVRSGRIMERRAAAAGLPTDFLSGMGGSGVSRRSMLVNPFGDTDANMNEGINRIEKAGGNPLVDLTKETNALLKQNGQAKRGPQAHPIGNRVGMDRQR